MSLTAPASTVRPPAPPAAPESADFFPAAQHQRIVSHMNDDHADAVLDYARHFAGRTTATAARLVALDRDGLDLLVAEPGTTGDSLVRVTFEEPLAIPQDAHPVLVQMARTARTALGEGPPVATDPAAPARPTALDRARAVAADFRTHFRTVLLGTVARTGEPAASVAAAVLGADGAFYIYVSALSAHTRNLGDTAHASVLLIEDESAAQHLLARKRLTFPCAASLVPRDAPAFASLMAALKAKFGSVMEQLESMTDFQLFRLAPGRGRLVAGFGQAYDVNPSDWTDLAHVGAGGGHGPAGAAAPDAQRSTSHA